VGWRGARGTGKLLRRPPSGRQRIKNKLGTRRNEEGREIVVLVNTPQGREPVKLREVKEPSAAENEALIEVRASP
jgi:hypothetical protein